MLEKRASRLGLDACRAARPGQDGDVIDIRDYAATITGGTLRPGDDAAGARGWRPGI
jgi:hypothetical protein